MFLLLLAGNAMADGILTDDIRIHSKALGFDLQYRVYLPENVAADDQLPVLFLTDGQSYIRQGRLPGVLDTLLDRGDIEPVVAVFVDARDPDDPGINRRNTQFFCNRDYLAFFVDELIPEIEKHHPVSGSREDRTIMGLSFGGLNAACFGLLGYQSFSGLGIQSPANHPVPGLLKAYEEAPRLPLRIFLSTGKPDDNTQSTRQFRSLLKNKGYKMNCVEVWKGHNWNNWRPLLDDAMSFFYSSGGKDQNTRRKTDP